MVCCRDRCWVPANCNVLMLNDNLGGMISKFADDRKIGGSMDSKESCLRLQQNLNQLGKWAKKWQMEFYSDKCKEMHFGQLQQAGLAQ